MVGYIVPEKMELRIREFEVYNAYYCGLCKEVGENYGQVSRFGLSNDMVFLALFLSAFSEKPDKIKPQHCILHPIKRKPVELSEQSIKYAADMMMILGGENFMDDVKDGERSSFTGKLLRIGKNYEKAANTHPEEATAINAHLQQLYSYETPETVNMNEMAACMGEVMKVVFTGFGVPEEQKRAVEYFAENLGKWLYMIDALDDFERDKAHKRFNPMLAMGATRREDVAEMLKPSLDYYMNGMANAFDLLHFSKNEDIIKNIVFFGIRKRYDEVMSGKVHTDDRRSI